MVRLRICKCKIGDLMSSTNIHSIWRPVNSILLQNYIVFLLRSTFPTPCPRRTRSSLPSTRAPRCRSLPRTSSRWRAFTRTSSGCTTTSEVCVPMFVTKGLKPVVNAHGRNSHQPYFSAVYIWDKFWVVEFKILVVGSGSDGNQKCLFCFHDIY